MKQYRTHLQQQHDGVERALFAAVRTSRYTSRSAGTYNRAAGHVRVCVLVVGVTGALEGKRGPGVFVEVRYCAQRRHSLLRPTLSTAQVGVPAVRQQVCHQSIGIYVRGVLEQDEG